MSKELPQDVQQQLVEMHETIEKLEKNIEPLLARYDCISANSQVDPLEKAQLQFALARSINALLSLHLRVLGTDPTDHPAKKELIRLAQYEKKLRKIEAKKIIDESKKTLEIDVGAVNRFITAAVPDLSKEQKAALKQAPKRAAERKQEAEEAQKKSKQAKTQKKPARDAALAFLDEAMADIHQKS